MAVDAKYDPTPERVANLLNTSTTLSTVAQWGGVCPGIVGVDSTGAPVGILIPAEFGLEKGRILRIKDVGGNAALNNISVFVAGSGFIDGVGSKVINTAYGSVTLYSAGDGVNWYTI